MKGKKGRGGEGMCSCLEGVTTEGLEPSSVFIIMD